jgi:hypothetical protein
LYFIHRGQVRVWKGDEGSKDAPHVLVTLTAGDVRRP